mgnify:CR=1 FL=1
MILLFSLFDFLLSFIIFSLLVVGNVVDGAWLGDADEPVDRHTIRRALKLYRRALVIQFLALAFLAALLV